MNDDYFAHEHPDFEHKQFIREWCQNESQVDETLFVKILREKLSEEQVRHVLETFDGVYRNLAVARKSQKCVS